MNHYIPDPATEAEWVIAAFLDALAADPATSPHVPRLRAELDSWFARYEEKYLNELVDEAARHALRQSITVLMAYRHCRDTIPTQTLLATLQRCFVEPLRERVRSATAQMLDEAADPFGAIVNIAKLRERSVFGHAFRFETRRDDDHGCYMDVMRCLWHSFFVAEGCAELTAIFCAVDGNWIEAIDPARHGVHFERATTLGTGGSLCPFHFFRVKRIA